jgi:pyrroloquinoline quinone (PQQ) biosynthesis protein C
MITTNSEKSSDGTLSCASSHFQSNFKKINPESSEKEWNLLFEDAKNIGNIAFNPFASKHEKTMAELALHRVLYSIYSGQISVPFNKGWRNLDDYRFVRLRELLECAWYENEKATCSHFFDSIPEYTNFEVWATENCRNHRSNVIHPIFNFLCNEATFEQLREFVIQETPFDIHFGDILAKMLPGVYGSAKSEFTKNFWDEMGRGKEKAMHRQLRINMTNDLGLTDDFYLTDVERFIIEELRLANMYFHAVFNRALLPQAIGMMLVTELMVPGRFNQQIEGWRRVGWPDNKMNYLIEHTVVDVEHAEGWMQKVIKPILNMQPNILVEITLGMARRLQHAEEVCDAMLSSFKKTQQEMTYAEPSNAHTIL